MRRSLAALLVGLASLAVAVGCGASDKPTGGHPEPFRGPKDVVSGAPGDFSRITVAKTGGVPVEVTGDLRAKVAPLVVARNIEDPDEPGAYGLDAPQAELVYERADGTSQRVQVGAANFDRRGVYVRRDGDSRVFMVLAESLRPVLALAGIDILPPQE